MKQSIRIVMILMLFFALSQAVFAKESRLYQNDRPFEGQNVLLSVDGVEYAPLSFFEGFDGVTLCREHKNFCLSGQDGQFFSHLASRPNTLLTESLTLFSLPLPEQQGECFLPLSDTAEMLGLSLTYLEGAVMRHARLCDGNEQVALADLVALYDARP